MQDRKARTQAGDWARTLSGAPILDRTIAGLVPASVRHWRGITASIDQHALDQHFISVHLGGPKRLQRRGEGPSGLRDVEAGAYSVVPAGAAYRWETTGPINFAHFYFDPKLVDQVVARTFDRNPSFVHLHECLGEQDPLIHSLALNLLDELTCEDSQQGYLEDMLHLILCRAMRLHSNVRSGTPSAAHVLAPYRLRRAVNYIEANLASPIGVGDIAAECGFSAFHFSRAFRQTTGRAPYAYVLERRMLAAKAMLRESDRTLTEIALDCGFTSLSQFSRMFKRKTATCPSDYRNRQ